MTSATRQKHSLLRIAVFTLILLIALFGMSGICGDSPAFADTKAKLSKTKVSVDTGSSAKLSVKNAAQKVQWTTSDKKCVAIKKTTGKLQQTAVLKAGKKTGSCWVSATIGKQTLKCKVTVKKPDSSKPKVLPLSKSSVDLSKKYKYKAAKEKDSSADFDKAYTDFAIRLLQATLKENDSTGNVLISPDSMMTALTMAENGAGGKTQKEMQKVLSGSVKLSDANDYLHRMHSRLSGCEKLIYTNSNSIWMKKGAFKPAAAFLKTNKKFYNAPFYSAAFDKETTKDINKWVYNRTRNMIKKIIGKKGLSKDAQLVITNAVAFEGPWSVPLHPVTADSEKYFTSTGQKKHKVTMLAGTGDAYLDIANGQGFCYYYSGKDIAFLGILPPEGASVRTWAATLSGEDLTDAWKNRTTPKGGVVFHVPAFKYNYTASMKNVLKRMGMKKAFKGSADFSGMVDSSSSSPAKALRIDEVLHKTHIELDQNGTRAAAATDVVISTGAAVRDPQESVYLDRPFVYGLIDVKTGNPLFLGIVETL